MSYGSGGKYSPYSDVDQEDEIVSILKNYVPTEFVIRITYSEIQSVS